MKMLRFWDGANGLTLVALMASVGCALLAVAGRLGLAVVALIVAGLCDLFDGLVARRLQRDVSQREFGARLDSLVDGCAFGFSPIILVYCSGATGWGQVAALAFFCCGVVWRLAYFDTVGIQVLADGPYYVGLPTTYVALVIPLVYTVGLIRKTWLPAVLTMAIVILTFAMVSSVPIRKPGGVMYVVFLLLAAVLIVIFLAEAERLASARL